jgi:hypothetical protein
MAEEMLLPAVLQHWHDCQQQVPAACLLPMLGIG